MCCLGTRFALEVDFANMLRSNALGRVNYDCVNAFDNSTCVHFYQTNKQKKNIMWSHSNASHSWEKCITAAAGHECVRVRQFVHHTDEAPTVEIDAIVVTADAIYVVEVKSWAGYVVCDRDGHWIECLSPCGDHVDHGIALNEVKSKARLLANFLTRARVHQPPESVIGCLVLTHPDCCVAPATLRQHRQHVMTLKTFTDMVKPTARERLYWLLPYCEKTMERQRVLLALEQLPTFDTLVLHDGTIRHGRVEQFSVPNGTRAVAIPRAELVVAYVREKETGAFNMMLNLLGMGTHARTINLWFVPGKQPPHELSSLSLSEEATAQERRGMEACLAAHRVTAGSLCLQLTLPEKGAGPGRATRVYNAHFASCDGGTYVVDLRDMRHVDLSSARTGPRRETSVVFLFRVAGLLICSLFLRFFLSFVDSRRQNVGF